MTVFTTFDGRSKLKEMIATANITYDKDGTDTPVPIIYPNVSAGEGQRPRIEMAHVMAIQTDGTLKGNSRLEERGVYDFTIVVKYNSGEQLAAEIAERIKDVYPAGSNITIPNGVIQIPDIPSVGNIISMGEDARLFMTMQYVISST